MIIATAGHVDHGKTSLLRALTGIDTDRLPEEKQRGMSIDLGFAYTDLDGQRVGFVDVPGHERFIRNMLAGVAAIDFALLAVAADDGVMPQTLEHLAILDLLAISRGAVAVTKTDRASPARVAMVMQQVQEILEQTSLRGSPVFAVSAIQPYGVSELRRYLAQAAANHSARSRSGNFRLAIDRCFSLRGIGVTVTGTVFSGSAAIGDNLMLSPSGLRVRVRGIHASNAPVTATGAGQRSAINIAAASGDALDVAQIHRGNWLLAPDAHAPTARIDMRLHLLGTEAAALKHWTPVHVHTGANHSPGRIALLEGATLAPGEQALAQMVLDQNIGILRGDRIILRDASARRTIAGGVAIDPFAPGKGRARSERLDFLRALEKSPERLALLELLIQSPYGVDLEKFRLSCNLTPDEAAALWTETAMRRIGRAGDQTGISETHFAAFTQRAFDTLVQWHQNFPHSLGPNETELRAKLGLRAGQTLLNTAVQHLLHSGKICRSGTLLHVPGHKITISRQDESEWRKIQQFFGAGTLTPPRIRELALTLEKTPEETEALLERLARAGRVLRVSKNRFFTPEILRAHAAIAEGAAQANGMFTAQEYRLLAAIGRNLTIELLEFFDRAGFTRRLQEGRVLRASAQDIFGTGYDRHTQADN